MESFEAKHEYLKFALKDGQLVSIDDVPNGNECGCQCPACGKDLCARNNGTKRIHHFAHQSGADCPGAVESSIHLLAKKVLKERFDDKNKSFRIQFSKRLNCCEYKTCPYFDDDICKSELQSIGPYDLKEYYDTCVVEAPDGDFRPDLLLTSSTKKDREPIYIEILYKHKCEESKVRSGKRIIEIKVESETDVLALGSMDIFKEDTECRFESKDRQSPVKFYFFNFQCKTATETPIERPFDVSHFILHKSGLTFCDRNSNCCDAIIKRFPSSKAELNIRFNRSSSVSDSHLGLVYLLDKGHAEKNCKLCTYFRADKNINSCALYIQCQTPHYPKENEAERCPYYEPNKVLIDEAREIINSNNIEIIEINNQKSC